MKVRLAPTQRNLKRLRIHGLGHVPLCADVPEALELYKRNSDWVQSFVRSSEWPNEWVMSVKPFTHYVTKKGKFKKVK